MTKQKIRSSGWLRIILVHFLIPKTLIKGPAINGAGNAIKIGKVSKISRIREPEATEKQHPLKM